jgi:hypothetical protein
MEICGLEIFDLIIKLVATAALVVTLLRLTFALERWGKK